ncbi:MAG: Tll0287-like domain-containing protein [Planctomycetota bacterium]
MKHLVALAGFGVSAALVALLVGGITGKVRSEETSGQRHAIRTAVHDQELARLLVKLELRTRGVIAGHYVGADKAHRAWMARSKLLPAAVADAVFYDVVHAETQGRAWVKMVVEEPRNPNNEGDATALTLFREIRDGKPRAEYSTGQAYYYAEPIKTAKTCLACHGQPAGDPDPFFPRYRKNGWRDGETVGAVVARVATAP